MHKLMGIPFRSFGLFCILKYFLKKSMELFIQTPLKNGAILGENVATHWHKNLSPPKTISKCSNKQINGVVSLQLLLSVCKIFLPQEAVARKNWQLWKLKASVSRRWHSSFSSHACLHLIRIVIMARCDYLGPLLEMEWIRRRYTVSAGKPL